MRRTVPASRAGRSGSLRPPAAFPPVLHVTRSARSVRPVSCLRGGIRDEPTRPAAGDAVWVSGRRRERAAGADRERARGCAQAGAGPGTRSGPSREAQPGRQCLPISEMLAGTRGGRGLLGRAPRLRTTRQGRAERWAFQGHRSPRGWSAQGDKDKGRSELPRSEDAPGRGAWASRGEAGASGAARGQWCPAVWHQRARTRLGLQPATPARLPPEGSRRAGSRLSGGG